MIDLEKEREAFESTRKDKLKKVKSEIDHDRGRIYVANTVWDQDEASDLDEQWWAWQQRAELAQKEIEATKRELEFATKTINNLLEKLAKYENEDVVVVPREPTQDMYEAGWREFEMSESMHKAYKAMIEAVEKDHE